MLIESQAIHYPKAPIVEALIDIRFSNALSLAELEDASRVVFKNYASREPENLINYLIEIGKDKPNVTSVMNGYRLNSIDRSEICIIRQESFTISKLAPYETWDVLIERTKRDWAAFSKTVEKRNISRVAVRFINRIDIPSVETVKVEDYLRIYAYLPTDIGDDHRIDHYVMQLQRKVGEDCSLIINTASAVSPLPNHSAFLLDFDVYLDVISPMSGARMWSKLDEMRKLKNHMFEALITDKSRALFV